MSRYLLLGTLAATVTLFVWQAISNAAIPWHAAAMRELPAASVQALHAGLPGNGLYFAKPGILAAVNTTPDMADRTQQMGLPLARQVVVDVLAALVLAFVVLRLPRAGAVATAETLALAALAVSGILALSDWNWYGYPLAYELPNVIDLTIQAFLAGLVFGWALRRFSPTPEQATARVGVPA